MRAKANNITVWYVFGFGFVIWCDRKTFGHSAMVRGSQILELY